MRFKIYLLPALFFISCKQVINKQPAKLFSEEPSKLINKEKTETYANARVTYQVSNSPAGGYGYEIFINGNKIIDQLHLPGVETTKGFTDTAKAGVTALFVIGKIRKNQWPPSINKHDLDSLGVLK